MSAERYLVDTTIWVKFLRGMDDTLRDQIATLVLEDRVFTSEIIILEILRGAKTDREYDMLYKDFLALPRLGITPDVWEQAWRIAYRLRKKGVNVPLTDIIISSTASYYHHTLIHSDRHFKMIEKHIGMKTVEM